MTSFRCLTEAARYEMMQFLRGRRALFFLLLLSFPIAVAVANPAADKHGIEKTTQSSFLLFPGSTCLLLAIFYAGPLLQTEIERKTLTYLLVRPIPRWQMLMGRLLGVLIALEAAILVAVPLAWLISGRPGGAPLLWATWQASVAAILVYAPIALALGTLFPQRAITVGILWGLLFEVLLSNVPFISRTVTLVPILRSIQALPFPADTWSEKSADLLILDSSPLFLWGIVLSTAAAACAIASLAVTRREYALTEEH